MLQGVIILALLIVVFTMVWGIISMGRGGKYDEEHGERFMWARVALQGLAVLLLIMANFLI